MVFRTSPEIAAADREAHGRTLDAVSAHAVREAAGAAWRARFALSCGHAADDGFREDAAGRLGCAKLNCDGKVTER